MHHFLPSQRPHSGARRHYNSTVAGKLSSAQSGSPPFAGSSPAEPGEASARLGYRPESSPGGRGHFVPVLDEGDSPAVTRGRAHGRLRRASIVGRYAALALIRGYQLFLSPLVGPSCRYWPTCSSYTYEAIAKWGVCRGSWYALRRVLRCHPFGGHGYDPVP